MQHYQRGIALYQQGQLDEALASFRQHITVSPTDHQGHICLGIVLEALQHIEAAVPHYLEAVRLKPDPAYHYAVGCVLRKLRYQTGRQAQEAEQYEAAIQLKPTYVSAWYGLSGLYLAQGHYEDVLHLGDRAAQSVGEDPRLLHNIALALFLSGRDTAASETLDRSNELAATIWKEQFDGVARVAARCWFAKSQTYTELLTDTAGQTYGSGSPQILGYSPWTLPIMNYRQPQTYLVHTPQVYLEGMLGFAYDDDAVYVGEHVRIQGVWRLFSESPRRSPRKTIRLGKVASLHQPDWDNYYHWTVECLIRLLLLREALAADPDLHLLVPFNKAPVFIQESLKLLGIPESRLIRDQANPQTRYFIEDLLHVEWGEPWSRAAADEMAAVWYPPRAALHQLRQTLAEPYAPLPEDYNVVYVSRSQVERPRCVQQEEDLIAALRNLLGERLVVFKGQQPLSEQIETFRQAGLVIGPHGAGLTNILYCRPGTRVVEFPVVPMRLNQFAHLAAALDLEYWIVPTVTAHYQGAYTLDSYNLKDVVNLVEQLAG